jgi:hypothetical protein
VSRKKNPELPSTPHRGWLRRHGLWLCLAAAAVAAIAVVSHYSRPADSVSPTATASAPQPITPTVQKAVTLDKLLAMKPEELKDVDIAEMNLLCATGLKGSENLDVAKCMARLDDFAKWTKYYTEQSLPDFYKRPQDFKNSEAKFRVLLLISVLQREYGIHYNDRGEFNCDCSTSKNPFIHGMIDDPNGGTCASMPVMYVAIGRRLGYPLKLVLAKTHVFARWEDAKTGERFNIEGTNPRFDDHPDSYYQNWPAPITEAELKQGWYLKSLAPTDELAVFLQNRAFCLMDNGRFAEAKTAFSLSYRLAPQNPLGPAQIASAAGIRGPVSVAAPHFVPGRGLVDESGVPMVYHNPADEVETINAMNRANMQRLQSPQPGVPQPPTPYAPMNPYRPPQPRQPGMP